MKVLDFEGLNATAGSYPMWPCFKGFPFRPADWRWQAALRLAGRERVRWHHYDDPVRRLRVDLRRLQRCRGDAQRHRFWSRRSELKAAVEFWLNGGWPRSRLEAWLLTGVPVTTVASKVGLPPDVVEIYRTLFWDVAGRSRGWVIGDAIRSYRPEHSTEPYLFRIVKEFAYQGGPYVLESCLDLDIPSLGKLGLREIELSLQNSSDRRQTAKAALAASMLSPETLDEQLEFLAFLCRNHDRLALWYPKSQLVDLPAWPSQPATEETLAAAVA